MWVFLLSFWAAPSFGAGAAAAQGDVNTVVTVGSLIYLEAQAHTNLHPPAGGFYPNGGILNQIADRLTYQNSKTLKSEPWVAESWEINPVKTEYTCNCGPVRWALSVCWLALGTYGPEWVATEAIWNCSAHLMDSYHLSDSVGQGNG
jgi:hypothetical protein